MKALALLGPTASGKTSLSISLAQTFNGEVICCDSMQLYSEMEIGTAKPTKEEMGNIPHHLFGFQNPRVPFSVKEYTELAMQEVRQITNHHHLPIFCGGTGLYLDGVRTLRHDGESRGENPELRASLEKQAESEEGKGQLFETLMQIDPKSAMATHKNNVRRVIRALELFYTTGKTKTELDELSNKKNPDLDLFIIGLYFQNKELLRERIKKRIDQMIENGLIEETRRLYQSGVFEMNATAVQAIGYKEFLPYVLGEDSFENCKEKLIYATIHYAKRQMTYFQKMDGVHWLSVDENNIVKTNEQLITEIQEQMKLFLEETPCTQTK